MRTIGLVGLLLCACGGVGAVDWVADGKAHGRLFVPRESSRPLMLAVDELRGHVRAMTGADIPMAWRDVEPKDAGVVLALRPRGEWEGRESAQAFRIVETENPVRVTITGNTATAVLFGVYHYLHDQGVRWIEPGPLGTHIPKRDRIAIRPRDETSAPSFIYRCLDFSGWHDTRFEYDDPAAYRETTHHEWDMWLLRNRLVFDRVIHKGHYFDFNHMVSHAGHGLRRRCRLDPKDLDKTPERFALVTRDGKKERRFDGAQICFTNEENIANAIATAVEHFQTLDATRAARDTDLDEINDVIDMSLADHGGICECDACEAAAGEAPYARDRLVWSFMNRVARGLNDAMPGKKIMLFAPYLELVQPPDDVTLEPNIIAIACRSHAWLDAPGETGDYPFLPWFKKAWQKTQQAGAAMQCYEYVLWQNTPQPLDLLDSAPAYAKAGFTRYHVEVMQRSEAVWPLLWALAQFSWDARQDPHRLLAEACRVQYGEDNGALVLSLLKEIHANSRNVHRIVYGGPADASGMYTDAFIARARTALAEAEARSAGDALERLRRFADSMESAMLATEAYRAYARALNLRTPEAREALAAAVEKFRRHWRERHVARVNAPGQLQWMDQFDKLDFAAVGPKGRPMDEAQRLAELFAGADAPENIDVFWLPEVWKFYLDLEERGLDEQWQAVAFDDSAWPELSTYAMFEPQGYAGVDGRFWYRVAFDAPAYPTEKRVMLRIGSLDDDGEVFVNGEKAFARYNADAWDKSFAVDITDFYKPGARNLIAVRGYDGAGGGGLWRPCGLYAVDAAAAEPQ